MGSRKGAAMARRARLEAAAEAAYRKDPAWHPRVLTWGFTTRMVVSDLSRDDDFLSHVLVEKLGTGNLPLMVHKMNGSSRPQRTDANQLLDIVRRVRRVLIPQCYSTAVADCQLMPCSALSLKILLHWRHVKQWTTFYSTRTICMFNASQL